MPTYLDSTLTSKHDPLDTEPVLTLREFNLSMEGMISDIEEMKQWGGDAQNFVINAVLDKIVAHVEETTHSVREELKSKKKEQS